MKRLAALLLATFLLCVESKFQIDVPTLDRINDLGLVAALKTNEILMKMDTPNVSPKEKLMMLKELMDEEKAWLDKINRTWINNTMDQNDERYKTVLLVLEKIDKLGDYIRRSTKYQIEKAEDVMDLLKPLRYELQSEGILRFPSLYDNAPDKPDPYAISEELSEPSVQPEEYVDSSG